MTTYNKLNLWKKIKKFTQTREKMYPSGEQGSYNKNV